MDKLSWLKEMAEKQPDNAQVWYWLGTEWLTHKGFLEAMNAFTSGLRVCNDTAIREHLLQGIQQATVGLSSPTLASNMQDVIVSTSGDNAVQATTKLKAMSGLRVIDGGKSADHQDSSTVEPIPATRFEHVAGLNELKKTIQVKIISPFFNQGLFAKFRKKAGGGVLLYGPPGCGKTFIARATAGECNATFIPVHITDILDPYIGVSEQNLKDLFDKARYQKPSIMFFDELDAIGFNRAKSSSNLRGLIDTFLTEMQGIDTSTDQVLILGATNMPWDVDHALKRPGRFDRMVFVAPPDTTAREALLGMQLADRLVDSTINLTKLAQMTELFSGADLVNVCELAAERVLMEIMDSGVERPIGQADLEAAISSVQPSTLEWLRTAKNYVKYSNQSGLYNDVESYLKTFGRRI